MDDRQTSYAALDTFGQPDSIQASGPAPTRSCPTATTRDPGVLHRRAELDKITI
jgi:hypothetical protein